MKKLFQYLICKLYYRYCFKQDKQAQLFILYYFPVIFKNQPAGTYTATMLNEKTNEFIPVADFVKYPNDFIISTDKK